MNSLAARGLLAAAARLRCSGCRTHHAAPHQLPLPPQLQQQQPEQQQQQQPEQLRPWPGLADWRAAGVDARRAWSARTNSPTTLAHHQPVQQPLPPLPDSLVGVALQVLHTGDPDAKAALTHRGWLAYCSGDIPLHPPEFDSQGTSTSTSSSSSHAAEHHQRQQQWERPPDRPARPPQPRLVAPKQVPSFKASPLSSLSAHLLHNLAHIELNAVDLAWDTVARFSIQRLPDGEHRLLPGCVGGAAKASVAAAVGGRRHALAAAQLVWHSH
jgi:hypothetical protein